MKKNLEPIDYYMRELHQLNTTINAAKLQLSISHNCHETKYLEETIKEHTDRKTTVIKQFNDQYTIKPL